ncbi:sensitivity to red-light reduced protein [Tieghemiomyces parasiticus]|uniref:Sensitivity to red-light reduced protein n=1 Tax=Tieghemiomyces parasiticus TaxID=78921 RepID=A0A9W8E0I8_9FUNG|nr:sensitivity to red-light reduced protein [Tieghemiomyces parasiticus]
MPKLLDPRIVAATFFPTEAAASMDTQTIEGWTSLLQKVLDAGAVGLATQLDWELVAEDGAADNLSPLAPAWPLARFTLAFLEALAPYVVQFDVPGLRANIPLHADPAAPGIQDHFRWSMVTRLLAVFRLLLDPPAVVAEDVALVQRLRQVAQQTGLLSGQPLHHLAIVYASRWAAQCNPFHPLPPTEVSDQPTPLATIQRLMTHCSGVHPLLMHSVRVAGHAWEAEMVATLTQLTDLLPKGPNEVTPLTEETASELMAVTRQTLARLTPALYLLRAAPRMAWVEFAERPTLLAAVVHGFYQIVNASLWANQAITPNAVATSVGADLHQLLAVQLPWTLCSVTYLLLVLSGYPRDSFFAAWAALWPAVAGEDTAAVVADLCTMFAGSKAGKGQIDREGDGSLGPGRMDRLSQALYVIIEATQNSQPTDPSVPAQASLLVLLDRRFQLYSWLLEIQDHGDNESLAYAMEFLEHQLERGTTDASIETKMGRLSLGKAPVLLDPDLRQALELSRFMEPTEYQPSIAAVREVFPDLGEGYIWAALALSGYRQEDVIMQFLEDQIPAAVRALDRTLTIENLNSLLDGQGGGDGTGDGNEDDLLAARRNIFDGDEFDVFTRGAVVDPSRVYHKEEATATATTQRDQWLSARAEDDNYKQDILDRAIATVYSDDERNLEGSDDEEDPFAQRPMFRAPPGGDSSDDGEESESEEDEAEAEGGGQGRAGPSSRGASSGGRGRGHGRGRGWPRRKVNHRAPAKSVPLPDAPVDGSVYARPAGDELFPTVDELTPPRPGRNRRRKHVLDPHRLPLTDQEYADLAETERSQRVDYLVKDVQRMRDDTDFTQYLDEVSAAIVARLHNEEKGPVPHDIVCYGLGSFIECRESRLQLAFILHLRTALKITGRVHVYDPVLGALERAALEAQDCCPLMENEQCRRIVDRATLFYMPHCEKFMYHNLVAANAKASRLDRVTLIGNNLQRYIDRKTKLPELSKHDRAFHDQYLYFHKEGSKDRPSPAGTTDEAN